MREHYSIGKVAKLCNTPVKTLRYYDEINLLKPGYRNEDSNYRYYTKDQMTSLLVIRRLRALDFNLKKIKELISNPDLSNMEQQMERKKNELAAEIKLMQARHETIDSLVGRVHQGSELIEKKEDQDIHIEPLPAGRMLYSRQIMKQYCNADVSLQRWIDILEQCSALGIPLKSPIIVTFHNEALGQFLMKDCDVEFGVLVSEEPGLPSVPNIRDWGGGLVATTYHIGKYANIVNSHIAVLQWINKNGYEVNGPVSEKFILSPLDVADEADHVTQILIPIKEKQP